MRGDSEHRLVNHGRQHGSSQAMGPEICGCSRFFSSEAQQGAQTDRRRLVRLEIRELQKLFFGGRATPWPGDGENQQRKSKLMPKHAVCLHSW